MLSTTLPHFSTLGFSKNWRKDNKGHMATDGHWPLLSLLQPLLRGGYFITFMVLVVPSV